MKRLILLLSAFGTPSLANPYTGDVPQFVEQASEAGLNHEYTGAFEYFVGGGGRQF